MCLHGDRQLQQTLKEGNAKHTFEYVSELMDFPNYSRISSRALGTGPKIFCGHPTDVSENCHTEVTVVMEGSAKMHEVMAASGVGTVIGMHMSEEHKRSKAHINAIIAGHMSSRLHWLKFTPDELEKKE